MNFVDRVLKISAITLTLYCPLNAYAYLDPGTGSMLLSVLIGLTSSAYFVIRKLPSMILSMFFMFSGK